MLRGIAYFIMAKKCGKYPRWIMFTPYGPWHLIDSITGLDFRGSAWACILGLPFPLYNIYCVLKYIYLIYRGNYITANMMFPWNLDWQNLLLILIPPVFYIKVIKGVRNI